MARQTSRPMGSHALQSHDPASLQIATVDCPDNAILLFLGAKAGTVQELAQQWREDSE
jgi:hypothetical protein